MPTPPTRSRRLNVHLVRVLASYGFAYTADWAFTVAIGLVAYADGGFGGAADPVID